MLEYQLIRSKRRKTLLLQVQYGQVTVRAPYHLKPVDIDSFIEQKSNWLRAKISQQKAETNHCDFTQDAKLLFLGKELPLNITIAKNATVYIDHYDLSKNSLLNFKPEENLHINIIISERVNDKLTHPVIKQKQVKKQLEIFLKQQAEVLFRDRLNDISKKTSLIPTKLVIKRYKSRWGSCNNRGEVSLNYLLMMTPLFVIDYVIVHELSHLKFLDHSKNFWALVEKNLPQYKIAKQWLNEHQHQLQWRI
jgi:hypothetical protein